MRYGWRDVRVVPIQASLRSEAGSPAVGVDGVGDHPESGPDPSRGPSFEPHGAHHDERGGSYAQLVSYHL